MADGASFDFSEILILAADIGDVPAAAEKTIDQALSFTSNRIKKSAAKKVGKRTRFKGGAKAIDYEKKTFSGFGASIIQYEIGYSKEKGGAIGSLAEFGAPGSENSLAPGNELVNTLHEEEPDFQEGIEKALDDAMKSKGL